MAKKIKSLYTMIKSQYLSIENKKQRMVWSGLSSPLQHILYVQELYGRETHKFNYKKMKKSETMINYHTNNVE